MASSTWMLAGIFSFIGGLLESLQDWVSALPPAWLYATATVVAFGESAPAIGLIVPGQTIIFLSGFLAADGVLNPFLAAFLVSLGGFGGDVTGYVLGRRFGIGPLRILPYRLRPAERAQERLATLFDEHGMKAVMLARFQPIGRAFGPYFAGLSGMRASRFLVAAATASIATGTSLVGLGYLAGIGFERLSRTIGLVSVSVVTVLLIAVLAVGLRIKHKRDAAAVADDLHTP